MIATNVIAISSVRWLNRFDLRGHAIAAIAAHVISNNECGIEMLLKAAPRKKSDGIENCSRESPGWSQYSLPSSSAHGYFWLEFFEQTSQPRDE